MANIENEKKMVAAIIRRHCRTHHCGSNTDMPCAKCLSLTTYAQTRLSACRYGSRKPKCKACTTHCYAAVEREQIRKIMREIGPKIVLVMPIAAIRYLIRL